MKRIFLDFASTTPISDEVQKCMKHYSDLAFGNPSALYAEGLAAKKVVADSRESIGKLLNVRAEEVVFTGSGTESDNLALLGVFLSYRKRFKPHVIVTNIEHPGILEAAKLIERSGGEVSYIPVEENGIVDPLKIAEALRPTTIVVSVMYANNEIGTIQPLRDIARLIAEYKERGVSAAPGLPYFHTDACQAANYLDISFQKLGVDMMTLDASKVYGPKGIGLLAVRRYVQMEPMIVGGGQERGMRAGTENVPAIAGFALALQTVQEMKENESQRLIAIRDSFFEDVTKKFPTVIINGDRIKRLPNNINFCAPGLDAEFAVIKLDQAGISCSSASSCMNLAENSYSYVVEALGEQGKACRESSLRFTLGRTTTMKEISLTLSKIQSIISA